MPLSSNDLDDIALARRLLANGEAAALREQGHLTRAELAAACGGFSPDAVGLWETGRRTPRTEAALKLGRIYRRLGPVPA